MGEKDAKGVHDPALSRLTSMLLPSLAGEPDVRRPRGRDPREATARRLVLGDDGLPADVRARRLTGQLALFQEHPLQGFLVLALRRREVLLGQRVDSRWTVTALLA